MQPPAQEIVARDLHDTVWTFRHIFRGKNLLIFRLFPHISILSKFGNSGQPKRHLLTSGWSLFVSGKRLIAGDSILFIR